MDKIEEKNFIMWYYLWLWRLACLAWFLVGVTQLDRPPLENVAQPHAHHLLPFDLLEIAVILVHCSNLLW